MKNAKIFLGLSLSAVIALVYACQSEVVKNNRQVSTAQTAQSGNVDSNGTNNNTSEKKTDTPAANTGGNAADPTNFTMSWDVADDPGIVSYKIFVVPPDRNPRFAGKTDVPIQIKNYPVAELQKNGQKYSVVVSSDEVKTALGGTTVSTYCFTVVAVNGVGNSVHSPVICP
jgi:hypothetical protein